MAIGRISGEMLVSDLQRQGANLSLETDLIYFDVVNGRIGVNSTSPATELDVSGNITANVVHLANGSVSVPSFYLGNAQTGIYDLTGLAFSYQGTGVARFITGTSQTGAISLNSNAIIGWESSTLGSGNPTVALSLSSGNVAIGNGAAESVSGNLIVANLLSNVVTTDTISPLSGGNLTFSTTGNSTAQFSGTYALGIPAGTTLERPDAPNAIAGMTRINSETAALEFFEGTQWVSLANVASVITSTDYTGDGSTVAFALPVSTTTNATFAILDGNVQNPGDNYNVSGNVLTFVAAPASNVSIELRTIATATTVGSLQDGNVAVIVAAGVGVRFYSDTAALTERWEIDLNGDFVPVADDTYNIGNATSGVNTLYFGNGAIFDTTLTTTAVTADQVIGAFDGNVYSSADFIIEAIDSTNSFYQKVKILAIHDGANVNYTEYGNLVLSGTCGSFTVDYNTGNLRLLVTPSSANSTVFKAHCTMTMV